MKYILGGLIALLCLFGCSSEKGNESASQSNESLSEAVHQPLDKARDAEKQVFDGAEQQKRQAEQL